ncbi:DUF5687 family protein [Sunxiuqinia indica]|uniref:DUF5687 family protein n=1 Tax=Sunxiuqinia indica TaxID=2692584 RepID=UPI0013593F78|nr:DUF5687 family protein [Sunxiuqinia indica]
MKRSLHYFAWREVIRSSAFGKSLATSIMLGFLALYFSANFLILGFFIPNIIGEEFPGANPVSIFNSYLLVYFAFDLLFRQILQNLPTISFKPFIILNVKRSRIARYLLLRSVIHFFNVLPFFLLIPVTFSLVAANYPPASTFAWFVGILLIIFTNHFLTTYLKWWINESGYGFYIFIGLFVSLYAINFFGVADLTGMFGHFFDSILVNPLLALALLIPLIAFIALNFNYLKKNLYLNLVAKKQKDNTVRDFSWMNRLGDYGKFISLEVRMIWRNKRPRSQFMMTVLFLFYGLLIYKDSGNGIPDFIFILGGLLMVSMFSISLGQFFPAWHSGYFSMLMTQNFKMKQFLQSFYYMNVVVSFVYYLLTLPYVLLDSRIIYYHSAMLLYHIGINMNLIFLFGKNSKRALDLSGSSMFNYQGMGASQWLISFPLILGPVIIYVLSKLVLGANGALILLGGLGIVGILAQAQLFNYFTRAYLKQKHRLIKDYKNS